MTILRSAAAQAVGFALALSTGATAQTTAEITREALATYIVVDGVGVPDPLTETPGEAARGAEIFADPERGGCAGCHAVEGEPDRTQIGPSLSGVGARLSRSALRLWIINPTFFIPETRMPAYYSLYDGDADAPARPKPRLDAQAIEDIVAYLEGLKPISAAAGAATGQ